MASDCTDIDVVLRQINQRLRKLEKSDSEKTEEIGRLNRVINQKDVEIHNLKTELASTKAELAVAKGGEENMLTGAERSTTLWALNDRLSAFSRKLHLLYLSIRYYTFNDVWRNVTAGMLDRNNGEVARMAMSRWRRAASLTR